jgi:hypothetical protein
MARSYYSTIFNQSADDVWNVIRDFNNYPVWVDGAGESQIEAGRPGDSYAFAGEAPIPARNFQATLRVTPVVEGNRAFVEWWATFDCELDRCEERIAFFREAFAGWLESLRRHLNPRASDEDATGSFGSSPVHTV